MQINTNLKIYNKSNGKLPDMIQSECLLLLQTIYTITEKLDYKVLFIKDIHPSVSGFGYEFMKNYLGKDDEETNNLNLNTIISLIDDELIKYNGKYSDYYYEFKWIDCILLNQPLPVKDITKYKVYLNLTHIYI